MKSAGDQPAALKYVSAVGAVGLGLLLRMPFWSVLGASYPFLTFFPAVMLSAWIGGFGPGLLTTLLSALAAEYFFIQPLGPTGILRGADPIGFVLFVCVGIFISWVTGTLQHTRRREQRLRLVAEQTLASIGDAVIATDGAGTVTFLNRIAENLTGWAAPEATGKSLHEVFHIVDEETGSPRENPVVRALCDGVIQGLANHTILISRNGTRTPIDDSAAPIRASDGQIIGAVLVFRDITDRRRKERAVQDSREQLRTTLDSITDGFMAIDADRRLTYLNREAECILGKPAQDLLGKNHWEEYPDALRTIVESSYKTALHEQRRVHFEHHDLSLSRWFEVNAYPKKDGGLSVYFRDITERKRAEQLARETEEQLRLLAEANVIGILFCDVHGNVRDANDEYLRIIGYTKEDLHAGSVRWTDVTPPEWLPLDHQRLAEAHERGTCAPYEKEYVRPDGTRIPVFVGFVLLGPTREDAVAFVVDLSAQKRAEAALRESESNLRLALKASRMGVWTNDLHQHKVHWSAELEEIFGVSPGAFAGTEEAFFSHIHPDDRSRVASVVQEALVTGMDYRVEFRFVKASGDIGWMEGRGQALYDDNGKPVRLAGVGVDITDRKLIENELLASEARLRLANQELQQFTYAASHDLKEPLRTITSYVQLLDLRYREQLDQKGREIIQFAVKGTMRMHQLVDGLLEYARAGAVEHPAKSTVRVEEALDSSLNALRAAILQTGAVITYGELPEVEADASALTQILQNLISNSLKYRKPDEPPRVHLTAQLDGGFWRIAVRDNGEGIDLEFHERVFGVFQRLHGPEISGTGIGLATCKKIVERWGGRIWVNSQPGRGATFTFTIPATAEQRRHSAKTA